MIKPYIEGCSPIVNVKITIQVDDREPIIYNVDGCEVTDERNLIRSDEHHKRIIHIKAWKNMEPNKTVGRNENFKIKK